MTRMTTTIALLLALASCGAPRAHRHNAHVDAATLLTDRYAHSRIARWGVEATAAGRDCGVLLVRVPVVLDDSMIEWLHYGAGRYGVTEGGVRRFYRDKNFRGVVYRDATGRVWTYDVSEAEAVVMHPCEE
jgi:hypothetical protein